MLSVSQRASLEEATSRYEASVEPAIPYLESRGLSRAVTATYRLGVVTDPIPGHEQYVGMLSIPYLTRAGVVALKFRRLDDGLPKYLAPAGQAHRMFNVNALFKNSNEIAICEGEIDAITLDGPVGIPAVGLPGATAWKEHYSRILEGYTKVWVFADNDVKEDGSNPGAELGRTIHRFVPQAVTIHLPDNMDVNTVFCQYGPEALTKLVTA